MTITKAYVLQGEQPLFYPLHHQKLTDPRTSPLPPSSTEKEAPFVLTDVEVRYSLLSDRTGHSGRKAASRDCWKLLPFSNSSLTSFSLSNSYPNPNRMKYSSRLLLVAYATLISQFRVEPFLPHIQTLQVMKVRCIYPSDG